MTDKLHWMCAEPECENPKQGSLAFCATHLKLQRDEKKNSLRPKKIPAPIKRRSDKRAEQERRYNKRVKEWLVGKRCAVFPWLPATQVHHRAGRHNEMLMDETYWLAVSSEGHEFIHANSEYSRKAGYMVLRSVTEKKTI